MLNKKSATISAILTVLLLILLAVFWLLFELIAVNGTSERQGLTAITLLLVCQGVVVILAALFARWLTNFLMTKADWNPFMAVASAVLVAACVGGAISFLAAIIAIPLAGLR